MNLENIEKTALEKNQFNVSEKLESLHKSFDSKITPKDGTYSSDLSKYQRNWNDWLNMDGLSDLDKITREDIEDIKRMYYGVDLDNGDKTIGLKDVGKYKINPEYKNQNIKQQAGFDAEIISTAKENVLARRDGTGVTTYRADDRPDLYPKNDQYVDKVRVDSNGNIIERVQTKFVGNDGKTCLDKLTSKKYEKYLFDGKVDKIEIPSDYYDQIMRDNLIQKKIDSLQQQLDRVSADGNLDEVAKKQHQIDKLKRVEEMLEKSTVSSEEAKYARVHPKGYVNKLFVPESILDAHEAGKASAAMAFGNTIITETYKEYVAVMNGTKTKEEAIGEIDDILKKAGIDGLGGYGTGFIAKELFNLMSGSGSKFFSSLADLGIPGAAVSCITASYSSFEKYTKGEITKEMLIDELMDNIVSTTGNTGGMALAGALANLLFAEAAAGALLPAAGTFALSVAGGYVGCAVATKLYDTAVKYGSEGAPILADKAKTFATETIETVRTVAPEKVDAVRTSFNEFSAQHSLPFTL